MLPLPSRLMVTALVMMGYAAPASAQPSLVAQAAPHPPTPVEILDGHGQSSGANTPLFQLRPRRHYPTWSWPNPPSPEREVGMIYSVWNLGYPYYARSLGASYGRYLSEAVSVEGALEVARADHRTFGLSTLQLRGTAPTSYGPGSIVVGLAHSLASRQHPAAPRGLGWLVGAGLQPRVNSAFALRGEVQLIRFPSDDSAAIRLTIGVLAGLN
jgi:hypothetical protein